MIDGFSVWYVFGGIFLVSALLAFRSMREVKSPKKYYPKIENKMRKLLSGVINLPKS